MNRKRPALGRGLGSLIPQRPAEPSVPASDSSASEGRGLRTIPIERLHPSPEQPRKHFDRERLEQLAESIRNQGIIQPIVVSPRGGAPGEYLIVAGERRWRAAQLAGLHDVPVIVRDTAEHERLELALVENIQRADLNPIEEARAYEQLMDLQGYTHEGLAERLGRDRSTISNAVRLLKLPAKVQELVVDGTLSMGHARALLGLEREAEMVELAFEVVRSGLSVRATEAAVRKRNRPTDGVPVEGDEQKRRRIIIEELEERLRRRLGVRARVRPQQNKQGAGVMEIPYHSLDELDRLLALLLDERAD